MCRRPPCHWLLALVPCWFSAAASAQPITAPPESPARPAVQSTAPAQQPVDENVEKAREAFRKGNVDEALNLLKEAVKKNDTLPPAKLMFARMWAEANQPSMARLALEQAAAEEPHHPDIYIQLGQIALRESRLTDALLLFREGINVLQHGKWTNEQQNNVKTACYSGVAAVHEARGHWAEAQKVLESSLELNPKIGQLRQRLGRALFMLDRREDAVKELEKACQDDPNLEPEGVTLGALFNQRGEMQKAEEFFAYAVKKSPQNLRARLAFGNWLMEQDRFDDADREATAAAGIDPKAIDARMLKGFVARGRRDYAQAEQIFDDLLREFPSNFQASNQLALVLVSQGTDAKRQRARELAEVNGRQYQREPEALATLGWVYFKMGRMNEAQQLLAQVYQASGGNITAETAYYLACLMSEQQRWEDARKLLESAIKSKGRFFHRREAEELARNLPSPTSPPVIK